MPFTLNIQNPADRGTAEHAVFARPLADVEYGDLAGDILGDAVLDVRYNEPWAKVNGVSRVRIRADSRLATTSVRLIPGRFELAQCIVRVPNRGAMAIILYRIAQAAKHYGFDRLTAEGEKHQCAHCGRMASWGYYAFPRSGFDADIPAATPARPPSLAGCARLFPGMSPRHNGSMAQQQ